MGSQNGCAAAFALLSQTTVKEQADRPTEQEELCSDPQIQELTDGETTQPQVNNVAYPGQLYTNGSIQQIYQDELRQKFH